MLALLTPPTPHAPLTSSLQVHIQPPCPHSFPGGSPASSKHDLESSIHTMLDAGGEASVLPASTSSNIAVSAAAIADPSSSPSKSSSRHEQVCITTDHHEPGCQEAAESHVHINPIFESVSCVKKKLFAKLKFTGFHREDDDQDEEDDAAQTKSLSIDSMYITPSNNEETEEKLIQATNYFIASALIASAVLAIIIVWLFVGMHNFFSLVFLCSSDLRYPIKCRHRKRLEKAPHLHDEVNYLMSAAMYGSKCKCTRDPFDVCSPSSARTHACICFSQTCPPLPRDSPF